MSEAIKVGDLVQVVRAHCEKSNDWLGHVFQVVKTGYANRLRCTGCGEEMSSPYADRDDEGHYAFEWLKRIDPRPELVDENNHEELLA